MNHWAYPYYIKAKEGRFSLEAVKIAFNLDDEDMDSLELLYRKEHEAPNLLKEQAS